MEDLRSKTKKNEDSGSNTRYDIFIYMLKYYKPVLIGCLIIFILMYPYIIGNFIGTWCSEFKNGILLIK